MVFSQSRTENSCQLVDNDNVNDDNALEIPGTVSR